VRPALAAVLVLAACLLGPSSPAQESTCSVETRQADGRSFRVARCDEDAAAVDDAMARAQASCNELAGETQARCHEAVAASFELRRKAMIRRALREGMPADAVADRLDASIDEVQQVQAEMSAPPVQEGDPAAEAARAALQAQVEQDLAEELAQEDPANPAP